MKKKIISGIVIIALIGGVGFYINNRDTAVEVNTLAVIEDNLEKYVEELGVVKSKNQGGIYAPVAGLVTEVLVNIGDEVKKGDVLVRLDKDQLSRQITELEAQRAVILAQYNQAIEPINKKGIERLELEIVDIEKKIKIAEETSNNKKVLYDAGAISHEEYRNSIKELDNLESNLQKVKLDLEHMQEPMSENITLQYEAQLKQLEIQREGLQSLGKDYTIIANISGTVLNKIVDKGSYLQPGMHIMEIGNTKELYIESDILVGDIAKIHEGAKVKISNKDLGIVDLAGTVKKIHPNAFSKVSDLGIQQKRIKVDIEINGAIENLRPGYDLDIKVIIDARENTLLVPENAVFTIDGKSFVFINDNGIAVLREVETGIESQRQIEIVSGLKKGEIVILSPDENIEEGIAIK